MGCGRQMVHGNILNGHLLSFCYWHYFKIKMHHIICTLDFSSWESKHLKEHAPGFAKNRTPVAHHSILKEIHITCSRGIKATTGGLWCSFSPSHWKHVTKIHLGQSLECWSNVSQLRFDQSFRNRFRFRFRNRASLETTRGGLNCFYAIFCNEHIYYQ